MFKCKVRWKNVCGGHKDNCGKPVMHEDSWCTTHSESLRWMNNDPIYLMGLQYAWWIIKNYSRITYILNR